MMTEDIEQVLLNEAQLREKVHALGEQISKDYAGKKLLVIGVLKGSFIFMADLIRSISIPCQIEFMAVSSYHAGVKSSGEVKILKDIDIETSGYHILLVEDILDSGLTLFSLKKLMLQRNTDDVKTVTLLDKPDRRKADISADYVGFEVPDAFLVGYGLDYAERYRNLPYIGILKPSVYQDKA